MREVLVTDQLSKNYGSIKAVSNLSLKVEEGAVYGLLGPNGSGKTSTLGMLLGITIPTSGSFQWFGQAPSAEIRKQLGAVLESPNFYPFLTAYQNLKVVCEIKEIPESRIPEVMAFVNLEGWKHKRFKTFSTGMKQRLAIASALLNDPEVLILDEPTNGLDPQGIAEVRELIRSLADNKRTILLASHLLDEVEKVCSHVAVMQQGELLKAGKVAELLSKQPQVELNADDRNALEQQLKSMPEIEQIDRDDHCLVVTTSNNLSLASLNQQLFDKGIILNHLQQRSQNLEEQFLAITQPQSS
jgi:ABC-2 type transport system ATP-binding protein